MKKIKTSDITTAIGMPIKSGSLDHLQSAYTEVIASLVKNLTGSNYDPTKAYIVEGLENTGTYPNYTVTGGTIFYQNELFLVDTFAFSVTSPAVANGTITTTHFSGVNADPVTFTDATPRNVHEIRKITFASGSASPLSYENLIPLQSRIKDYSGAPAGSFVINFGSGSSGVILSTKFSYTRVQDLIFMNFVLYANLTGLGTNNVISFALPLSNLGLPIPINLYPVGFRDTSAATPALFTSLTPSAQGIANIYVISADTFGTNYIEVAFSNLTSTGSAICEASFWYRTDG